MRRTVAGFLVVAMVLPFVLTATVLVSFHLERDRIIKELCVQRALPEAEQTCHGQCQLKKQLQAAEAPQDVPALPRLELRMEPAISSHAGFSLSIPQVRSRSFGPEEHVRMGAGYPSLADPVPWG